MPNLTYSDFIDTGERTPRQGDHVVTCAARPHKVYLDRHGVIGRTAEQLNAISNRRAAISLGVTSETVSASGSNYYSGVTLPNITDTVGVVAFNGATWAVNPDGTSYWIGYKYTHVIDGEPRA